LVVNTIGAFSLLSNDGGVVSCGMTEYGGDSSKVNEQLVDVKAIYSNDDAFVALKKDGTVVTWGNKYSGGDSSEVKDKLINIKAIFSTSNAFAALKKDGTVIVWGNKSNGGDNTQPSHLTDVKNIYSRSDGFYALYGKWNQLAYWGAGWETSWRLMHTNYVKYYDPMFAPTNIIRFSPSYISQNCALQEGDDSKGDDSGGSPGAEGGGDNGGGGGEPGNEEGTRGTVGSDDAQDMDGATHNADSGSGGATNNNGDSSSCGETGCNGPDHSTNDNDANENF